MFGMKILYKAPQSSNMLAFDGANYKPLYGGVGAQAYASVWDKLSLWRRIDQVKRTIPPPSTLLLADVQSPYGRAGKGISPDQRIFNFSRPEQDECRRMPLVYCPQNSMSTSNQ